MGHLSKRSLFSMLLVVIPIVMERQINLTSTRMMTAVLMRSKLVPQMPMKMASLVRRL